MSSRSDPPAVSFRQAAAPDVPQLIELMAAHAAYENASFITTGLSERLHATLLGKARRASCYVASTGPAPGTTVIGYATCAMEYSTWAGGLYLHMDTLFVDEANRGRGVGELLTRAVLREGAARGLNEVQWQTPEWNRDAIRFYERMGAEGAVKRRFKYTIAAES
jgi:ribosomal protein S18 acetylase RimI-like enzyme